MLLRRIRNLWKWSGFDPLTPPNEQLTGFQWKGFVKPKKQLANIVDFTQPDNPVERELK